MYLIEGVLPPSTNPLTTCYALCLAETTKTPDATSRKESSAFNLPKVQTYVWNSRTRKHLTIYFNRKRPTSFLRNKSYSYCHIPCALLALSSERVGTKIQLAWRKTLQSALRGCATIFTPGTTFSFNVYTSKTYVFLHCWLSFCKDG